jgi:hypothetical protein
MAMYHFYISSRDALVNCIKLKAKFTALFDMSGTRDTSTGPHTNQVNLLQGL